MHPQTQPCLWELMEEMCAPLLQLTHGSSTSLGPEPPSLGISGCWPLRLIVHSVLAARSLLPSLLWSWFLCAAWDVSGRDLVFITSC